MIEIFDVSGNSIALSNECIKEIPTVSTYFHELDRTQGPRVDTWNG